MYCDFKDWVCTTKNGWTKYCIYYTGCSIYNFIDIGWALYNDSHCNCLIVNHCDYRSNSVYLATMIDYYQRKSRLVEKTASSLCEEEEDHGIIVNI